MSPLFLSVFPNVFYMIQICLDKYISIEHKTNMSHSFLPVESKCMLSKETYLLNGFKLSFFHIDYDKVCKFTFNFISRR